MYGDDPKFRAQLQTIFGEAHVSLQFMARSESALNPNSPVKIRPSPISARIEDT